MVGCEFLSGYFLLFLNLNKTNNFKIALIEFSIWFTKTPPGTTLDYFKAFLIKVREKADVVKILKI